MMGLRGKFQKARQSALNMAESHRKAYEASREYARHAEGLIELFDLLIKE